jgi:hypothetical protein
MGFHRAGGKVTGSHTSAIELAANVVDFLNKLPEVTKISLGVITPMSAKSSRRIIKILPETYPGLIQLKIIQRGSVQEMRFYTDNTLISIDALTKFVDESGWEIKIGL